MDDIRRDVADRVRESTQTLRAEQLLVDTLCRVPPEIREKALERCFFISIGAGCGGYFLPGTVATGRDGRPCWLVVLNEDWTDEDFRSAVAHELAHIALGHAAFDLFASAPDRENEVADLVRSWGFSGMGALDFEDRPD